MTKLTRSCALALLLATACTGPSIKTLVQDQGAPGAQFVIKGTKITETNNKPFNPPEMMRAASLKELTAVAPFQADRITVAVPAGLDPGLHMFTATACVTARISNGSSGCSTPANAMRSLFSFRSSAPGPSMSMSGTSMTSRLPTHSHGRAKKLT